MLDFWENFLKLHSVAIQVIIFTQKKPCKAVPLTFLFVFQTRFARKVVGSSRHPTRFWSSPIDSKRNVSRPGIGFSKIQTDLSSHMKIFVFLYTWLLIYSEGSLLENNQHFSARCLSQFFIVIVCTVVLQNLKWMFLRLKNTQNGNF